MSLGIHRSIQHHSPNGIFDLRKFLFRTNRSCPKEESNLSMVSSMHQHLFYSFQRMSIFHISSYVCAAIFYRPVFDFTQFPDLCKFICKGMTDMTANTGEHMIQISVFRSEEHTSELQSRGHLVCRLLLEQKR